MKYIVDTNVFRTFFRFYYDDITPELFNNLDSMIREGKIISVKEVYHELENQHKKDSDFMNNIKVYKKDVAGKDRDKVIERQMKLVDLFRKISNAIEVDTKSAEVQTTKEIINTQKKYKVSDITDEVPDSAAASGSVLF